MSAENPIKTVLVVDQERVVADTLAIILRKNGFDALAIYSGEEAVAVAEKLNPKYVVLSEILMTGMSGIEVGIRIRTLCPECEVILFSGATLSADLLEAAREQGHQFEVMAKPFLPETLIEKLRAA